MDPQGSGTAARDAAVSIDTGPALARSATALVLAACALTLSACAGRAVASPEPTPTPVCRPAELTISLVHSGAAAGTVGGYLQFTSHAAAPCHLAGWPEVVPLTAAGASGPTRHAISAMFGPYLLPVRPVPREPGAAAEAVFTGSDNPVSVATCQPSYRYLRVTPPGNRRGVLISAWLRYLDAYLPDCAAISISAVVSPSTPYQG